MPPHRPDLPTLTAVSNGEGGTTLYYFTQAFPFGFGEMWKFDELQHLAPRFARTLVVPLSYDGNRQPCAVPFGVEFTKPIFDELPTGRGRAALATVLRSPRRMYYLRELLRKRVWMQRPWMSSWAIAALRIEMMSTNEDVLALFAGIGDSDVMTFFWGRGACDLLPVLRPPARRRVVRMHRFDLFEDENAGYIPFRSQLLDAATTVAPSSAAGRAHLSNLYPAFAGKIETIRMGSVGGVTARTSDDGTFRVVTCSVAAPVKRLDLFVDALEHAHSRIEWTHIGDGPLFERIAARVRSLPSNVTANLVGRLGADQVLPYYGAHPVDLFVNVSSSEGVPFSIMEALSASIPVLATAVGGTGEIVDDAVGRLVPRDITAEQLASELDDVAALEGQQRATLRAAARERWRQRCDADQLSEAFAEFLVSQRETYAA